MMFIRIILLSSILLLTANAANAEVWTVLAADAKGDAQDPSLADAAQLAYRYDQPQDYLWFRVNLYGRVNQRAFGINLVFDTGADQATKMNWWGANNSFKFDRLVTAWVTKSAQGFQGTIGIGDASGAAVRNFNNLSQNNLQLRVEDDSILIGVKRSDLTDKTKLKLIAAVGSNEKWNDDIPNLGFSTIDLSAPRPKRGLREIDLSRNNYLWPSNEQTLADQLAPQISKLGQGQTALILIPGSYSGRSSFAAFMARNQSNYRSYLLTPPGINGTPPRAMPAAGSSFGTLSWTRRLERDLLDLIRRERLVKPVLVAERQPGSIAALELAFEHPEAVGGVVLVGTNLVQFFPSPKDLKQPIAFSERAVSVDEGWGDKWFKYVTPETWNSGDLPAEMLSNDPARSQTAWQEIEATPLPIKVRYLCEFWAADVTHDFDKLKVPVLALIPGFDEAFLADPFHLFAKLSIIGSWETLIPKHPQLELVKIPNARLLLLDDQPKLADEALATFIERIRNR